MRSEQRKRTMAEETTLTFISDIVQATIEDWNLALERPLGAQTRLSEDLCFSSVEVLHLLASIDMKIGRKLPFERLIMIDGAYRSELTLGELAAFVSAQRDMPAP